MSSVPRWLSIGGALALLCTSTVAGKPTALSVVPSLSWYVEISLLHDMVY